MFGWGRKDREIEALRDKVADLKHWEALASEEIESLAEGFLKAHRTLQAIASMETPGANATVKRMARLAREGSDETARPSLSPEQ